MVSPSKAESIAAWILLKSAGTLIFAAFAEIAAGGNERQRPRRGETEGGQTSPVQQASEALEQTLEKSESTTEDVKAKLLALRNAREKSKQELVKAQQELREVLTVNQEARLVLMGLLD